MRSFINKFITLQIYKNLKDDGDMTGTGIMAGIYSSPSPYPIEKIRDSPYPYPYPVNARIPRQNGDGFGQYPWGRVYLPSAIPVHGCCVFF